MIITNTIEFTIPGLPVAKGRPRFSNRGGFVKTYTPKKTATFENKVALFYTEAANGIMPTLEPITITISAYFPIPKSWPKYRKESAFARLCPHTKRPDIDNVAKSVIDGLACAMGDDSQVFKIECSKYYSNNPRTDVTIRILHDEQGQQKKTRKVQRNSK